MKRLSRKPIWMEIKLIQVYHLFSSLSKGERSDIAFENVFETQRPP